MPWAPELFSAPALERILDKRQREHLRSVPFFDGLMAGEIDPLLESFTGPPELHHPVRGRVKGEQAFRQFVTEMNAWIVERNVDVADVHVLFTPTRGVEEVVLHLDSPEGRTPLPVALAADHNEYGRLTEVRLYFSTWPFSGRHDDRPPLLQPDPGLQVPDLVAAYQQTRATGLELCTISDDGRTCALEYNAVYRSAAEPVPQAGLAVLVRDDSGGLGAVRSYDAAVTP